MKNQKTILLFVAMLFASRFLFAVNPNTETADEISNTMVENTHKDVKLTNEQKNELKMKAKDYAVKLQQARAMSDKTESFAFMKTVTADYQIALDSLLTPDQKVLKEKKNKERIDGLVAKVKSGKQE